MKIPHPARRLNFSNLSRLTLLIVAGLFYVFEDIFSVAQQENFPLAAPE